MTRSSLFSLGLSGVSTVVLVVGALAQPSPPSAPTAPGERPRCVEVTWQARFDGSGHSHWVTVRNGCERAMSCTVRTDVAPSPIQVALAPGQSREVRTFLSSPATAFTPVVDCRER
ncbi:MAG: hypothetical protein OHK0013_37260 [Sandaracinaceae bacterium]